MLPLEFDYLVDIIKKIPSISNKQANLTPKISRKGRIDKAQN